MLVGRRSSELSGHQNLKDIKKVTTSEWSVAQWRNLRFNSSVTLRSTLAEELAQQFSALFCQLAACHQHLVVEARVIQDLKH